MTLPRSILAPTDFSDTAESAVDYAFALARACAAQVHLLHVYTLGEWTESAASRGDFALRMREGAAARLAESVAKRERLPELGHVVLRQGDPSELIARVARELPADLIVMGTRGRHDLQQSAIGSVLDAVLRTAHCPVLAVHPPKMAPGSMPRFHRPSTQG